MENRFIKIGLVIGILILFLGACLIPSIGATNKEKHVSSIIGRDTMYSGEIGYDIESMAAKSTDNMNDQVESTVVVKLNSNGYLYNGQTIYGTIEHDGLLREYILYIPDSYTGDDPVPLVFNFHGYTSSAETQMNYADFRPVSDNAGFLIVHPQGTTDNLGNSYWNVGGYWHPGGTADDVGFTDALIDHLSFNYSINSTKIYATGMSNGGFFSFHLAGQLSDRIAAIAPVAGTMTPYTFNNYDPQHPTPILQIHGTADFLVPYDGSSWSLSVDEALDYWIDYNNCNPNPIITELPDIDPSDGSTVTHIVYEDGDNGVTVEHFRVNGGGHDWPGSNYGGNQDIDACAEIWQFFSNYSLDIFFADANGPYHGFTQEEIQFEGYSINGVPPYQWHWDFGDGLISNEQNPIHSYDSTGNYTVVLTVEDAEDNTVQDTTWALIIELSKLEPPKIFGPPNGKIGVEYDYCFLIPNITYCDSLRLRVDWGVDGPGKWHGPFLPGENVSLSYTWGEIGDYKIRAQVMDVYGTESDWSEKDITMPRNRLKFNNQLWDFYSYYFNLFNILRMILQHLG
jgi:polyhydroxybutyrate depolymerase